MSMDLTAFFLLNVAHVHTLNTFFFKTGLGRGVSERSGR